MIEGKKLESTIDEFEKQVAEMGSTVHLYKDLVNLQQQIKANYDQLKNSNVQLEDVEKSLRGEIDASKANSAYLEKWKDDMQQLTMLTQQLHKQIQVTNKLTIEQNDENKELRTSVNSAIDNLPEMTAKYNKEVLSELQGKIKIDMNGMIQDIGTRMSQFIDMQTQLNTGLRSEITQFQTAVTKGLDSMSELQKQQMTQIIEYKQESQKKIDLTNKILFVNICLAVICLVAVLIR